MKRLILTSFVLVIGAALGAGGFYLATNYQKLGLFGKPDPDEPLQRYVASLRKACGSEAPLKGSIVKTAKLADGKLVLHGVVARQDQVALLEARGKELLDGVPELRSHCSDGIATDGLKVLAINHQVGSLQRDFDEARGAETDNGQEPLKREVMRTTRLDDITIGDDGKVTVHAVCIRGAARHEDVLRDVVQARLEALGVPATSMPEIALAVRHFASPVGTLQKKLGADAAAKNVRLVSASYDAKGKLHVWGLIGQPGERKLVEAALDGLARDEQTQAIVKAPDGAPGFTVHLETFQADTRLLELQKKLIEHARKENKPYLRRVLLEQVLATPLDDAKKPIATDDDGNVLYYFRVKGRLLEMGEEKARIEKELTHWLLRQLPMVLNPDRKPMQPRLALETLPSPIHALQQRIVQRGLDGAVVSDALFDEKGQLELVGRLHQPDQAGKQALDAIIGDVLGKDFALNLQTLKAHQSFQDSRPLAWKDALAQCQGKLAQEEGAGRRLRLDRLYYAYAGNQPQLRAEGSFLAEAATDNVGAVIGKTLDSVIASNVLAVIDTSAVRNIKSPLPDLQNLTNERSELDGVLLRSLRYGPDGVLHIDGYLGQPEHKAALAPIVGQRLEQLAGILKKDSDPKSAPGWSIDNLKPLPSGKRDMTWSDFITMGRAQLATSPEATLRRTFLARAYFTYDARDGKRQLALRSVATQLTRPKDAADDGAVKKKLEQNLNTVSMRLLADVGIDQWQANVQTLEAPIFELQKEAVARGYDGLLFQDASYDAAGKLRFDGIHGKAEQLKQAQALVDAHLAANKGLAPLGVAALDRLRLVAWQPLLDALRADLAGDKAALFKQTRIDRAYFQLDRASDKPAIRFQGICIYQGTVVKPDERAVSIGERLKKQLAARDLAGFGLDVAGILSAANPVYEMQARVKDNQWDGIVFADIGFDAAGVCYVHVPFPPKGQEPNLRALIDEASKKHTHLKAIQQR